MILQVFQFIPAHTLLLPHALYVVKEGPGKEDVNSRWHYKQSKANLSEVQNGKDATRKCGLVMGQPTAGLDPFLTVSDT